MTELSSVSVAVSPRDKFLEFLETRNMRLTTVREIVVDEVFASHEHFEAEQLAASLAGRIDGRRVSRSSVYRVLELLEEAGLLRKVARSNGRDVYEHDYGYPQHDHLICSHCGTLIEFPAESVAKIVQRVSTEHGFRHTGHRLEVYGTCEKCSRPPRRRHPKLDML